MEKQYHVAWMQDLISLGPAHRCSQKLLLQRRGYVVTVMQVRQRRKRRCPQAHIRGAPLSKEGDGWLENDVKVEAALPRRFYRYMSTELALDGIHILKKIRQSQLNTHISKNTHAHTDTACIKHTSPASTYLQWSKEIKKHFQTS